MKKFHEWQNLPLNESPRSDEVFNFFTRTFDIGLADKLIKEHPEKHMAPDGTMYEFNLKDINSWFSRKIKTGENSYKINMGVYINEEYAMKLTDEQLEEPGIWLNASTDLSILIDGWHRAFARFEKGKEKMKIWVISDPKDVKRISLA